MKHIIELTDDELRMIVTALFMHEDQLNCGRKGDKEYFSRVLALAAQLETLVPGDAS